jgi:hypothetical protein
VVIGALVAGTFFSGRLEQQTGLNTMYAAQASEVAEAGLQDAIAGQTAASLRALPADPTQWSSLGAYTTGMGNYKSAAREVSRLNNNLFLVRSIGTRNNAAGTEMARRSLGQLIRLVEADIEVKAGLTALGDVTITGGAKVSGNDDVPKSWSQQGVACPPLEDVTGVLYNNGTLKTGGNGSYDGDPPAYKDSTLNSQDMLAQFNKLKVLATLIMTNGNPPATQPAYTGNNPVKCDTSVESNWGEPTLITDPCFDYFPIIYHQGNLKLQGGRGQGILLVEGDLTATGGMVFYGPVFVTGTLSTSGNSNQGAKFYGGVISGNVALDDLTKLAGGALVNYSSCAVRRALEATATAMPFAERGWVQLYQ